MIKLLFVNTDLRGGGAEKVLVHLLNSLDTKIYDITLLTIFKEGINRQYLKSEIKQKWIFNKPFKGYSILQKLFSRSFLFRLFIKEKYDIIIAYLEGFPSRIVSGNNDPTTKIVSWIHLELYPDTISYEFRNKKEAKKTYNSFDKIVCVSKTVKNTFIHAVSIPEEKVNVIYNSLNINDIINGSKEFSLPVIDKLRVCTVGRLNPQKGYDRLLRIAKRLYYQDRIDFELLIIGIGPLEKEFKQFIQENELESCIQLLGYKVNPYPYIHSSDLFICSSYKEGYSTVVTESIILETPVITTQCSGMNEILENGKYGIVTENNEEDLYLHFKKLLTDKNLLEYYKDQTIIRSSFLKKRNTIIEFDQLINHLNIH